MAYVKILVLLSFVLVNEPGGETKAEEDGQELDLRQQTLGTSQVLSPPAHALLGLDRVRMVVAIVAGRRRLEQLAIKSAVSLLLLLIGRVRLGQAAKIVRLFGVISSVRYKIHVLLRRPTGA